ncbi:MAG TPA: glycosyltransferase family 1 protein [Roseiflexaceae bacterium]|nr:glycosyltransferase family 1 protein [Roseiflexaceae bacterium]
MRIAVDARYIADHFPGIGRYVYGLLSALVRLDQPHTLLVLHNPALRNSRFDLGALASVPAVHLVATGARPFSPGEQVRLPLLLRRLRADVYHAPYYVMPYAGLPCPAVVTLYDVIPRLFPSEVAPRARLLFDLCTRLALRAARGVIAISESARQDIAAAYRMPPGRIAVTPLAADERFRPQPPEALAAVRARYGLPARYVLALCSNKPHKNLPVLVEAWAVLSGVSGEIGDGERSTFHIPHSTVQLVLAGAWDPRYPEARELAARRGLGAAVRFLPDVAEADLPALYAGAEVFVFPSRYEGFGLPPLEAMACGVPVVCGAVASLPEVVGEAGLLVDITRPAAIAEALGRVLADAGLRARLSQAGLRRASAFSWRRTAALTLGVYERVRSAMQHAT